MDLLHRACSTVNPQPFTSICAKGGGDLVNFLTLDQTYQLPCVQMGLPEYLHC